MPGRETHHPDLKLSSRRRRHVDWETSGHAAHDRASTRSSQLRSPESPLLTAASTTRPDIAASESPSRTVRLRKIRSASRFFSRAHPHLCVASFFRAHWRGHGAQAIMHAACWPHGDLCSRALSHYACATKRDGPCRIPPLQPSYTRRPLQVIVALARERMHAPSLTLMCSLGLQWDVRPWGGRC